MQRVNTVGCDATCLNYTAAAAAAAAATGQRQQQQFVSDCGGQDVVHGGWQKTRQRIEAYAFEQHQLAD
jgi:hypothetical protein